jgi:hypothetical protein
MIIKHRLPTLKKDVPAGKANFQPRQCVIKFRAGVGDANFMFPSEYMLAKP